MVTIAVPQLVLSLLLTLIFFASNDLAAEAELINENAPHADARANLSAGVVLAMHQSLHLNLSPNSEITISPELTSQTIQKRSVKWQAHNDDDFEFGWNKHDTWIRHTLLNPSEDDQSFIVEFTSPRITNVELFQLRQEKQANILLPVSLELIKHQKPAAQLRLKGGEVTTLYWHVKHTGDVNFRLVAWHETGFFQHQSVQQLIFGITYGITALITLVSLFLFFASGNASYCFLALFAFTSLILFFQTDGYLYQYFAASKAHKLTLFLASLMIFQISFGLFARSFMKLRIWSQIGNRTLLLFTSISAIATFIALVGQQSLFLQQIAYLLNFLYLTCITIIALYVFKQGFINGLFLAITSALVALGLSSMFSFLKYFPSDPLGVSATTNALSLSHFVLLVGSLLYFYRSQQDQLQGTKELVKQTEKKLKATTERYDRQLQEAMLTKAADTARIEQQAKSRFLTAMSHEIRTPMSGILGMTELLTDTSTDNLQRQYIKSLQQASQNLLGVITELLDFSQIEAGRLELEAKSFDLQTLIDDCCALFSLRAQEAQLNFSCSIQPGTELFIKGDAEKLKQVIINLLNFTSRLAEYAAADQAPGAESNEALSPSSRDLKLIISNPERTTINSTEMKFAAQCQASHIPTEDRQRLTELFATAKSVENTVEASEITLTVSRELIERMHGQLGISFDDDRMTLWFTARFIKPNKIEQDSRDRDPILADKTLLIVDSDINSLHYIENTALTWGMKVTSASNIEQINSDLLHSSTAVIVSASEAVNPDTHKRLIDAKAVVLLKDKYASITAETIENLPLIGVLDTPLVAKQLATLLRHSATITRPAQVQALQINDSNAHPHVADEENPARVLIAEDNKVNRMVLFGMLKKMNLQVEEAENGAVASEMQKNKPFDLILMDCEMPQMDGFEATRAIREFEQSKHLPRTKVIALSAHADTEHKEKAKDAGMDDFMSKPISQQQLNNVIEHALPSANNN
jgi:signal transduction histidine kinase/CheY-like chemotaxis protein